MRNLSSILSISVAVTLSLLLASQIVITQVNSAVTSFRVYRNAKLPDDFIFPLPSEPDTNTNVSEKKSETFNDPWLPDSQEINSTLNANGTSDGIPIIPIILRRRRIKGKRRTTPLDSTESSTAQIATTTDTEFFTTETTEPTNTISGVLEHLHETTVLPLLNDEKNETTIVYPEPKEKDTTENNMEIFSTTFEDLFSPLPIDHETISERRKNTTLAYEYHNLDHLTQFKDNGNETDLHISESSNPYINSSTPISTELQKSLQFEYLHPILNSDNIITNAEQKIPENKTIIIQNALSSSLVNTPIAHDVRHSPGHLRKKHPLLNHDSIISSDFAKNGPRLDVPNVPVPIVPKITNSIQSDEQIRTNYNNWPEQTSKPSFPTSTVHDDDFGQGGFTVLLPKDFEIMEHTEKSASLDPVKQFGDIESTTKFNTYVRQTEPQNSIMPVLNTPQVQSTSTSLEQLNEYELLQQLLGIEKSLAQINLPNQPQQTSSEQSIPPQLSNMSNEEDLKALLQLPEFSFLDSILNPTSSTTSTTKKPTTTSTEIPSKKDKNTGLSDADLRSIYYMLERMVVHANNSSTTSIPAVTTTATAKPTTPSTTSASPTLFPSFDSIFNMFTTPGQTTQEKRNVAPGPVYKRPDESSPGSRDGKSNVVTAPAVATTPTQQKPGADNSLDLLTQLLQLSIAAESANANANNKPARSTPAPAAPAIPLDILTLLANSNLGAQGSSFLTPPATQPKAPEISPSETMQLLNIFSNQNVQKPNGLYYWLDLNAFLGGDPTADPLSGIRPKLGQREHFVKVRSVH